MSDKTFIIFVGPAGSGKSTLVYAYSKWLRDTFGYETFNVNLDPAAEYIPYNPDFDVRRIVDAKTIAKKFGLGPNGALVKAMDIITQQIDSLVPILGLRHENFILIDTPGQMEVFIFRDIAFKLIETIKKISKNNIAVFVADADIIKRSEDYAFLAIISVAIQARLGIDVIPVINKIDTAPLNDIIGDIISDAEMVRTKLRDQGLYGELLEKIIDIITMYSKSARVPKLSAKNLIGIEELHRVIHEITCTCGDLT
uniref:GTPase n=1 Tax=Ignisphaera aggregans TaxID=334771 RepID=A0A7C2VLH2_9CREN